MAREYTIEHRFVYVLIETTPYKYDLRCKDRSCPWRLTGTTYLDYVKVKRFIPDHTCSNPLKGNDHLLVTASWAAETCLGLFPSPGDIKPSLIREFIKDRWGITISYRKVHMVKVIIHEIKCGNAEASYWILPAYAYEMVRTNHGSVMRVCRSRDLWPNGDDTFGRLFFSFAPTIRALNTIRPLVLVDGIHLRGKYREILLVATGIDGNGGLFPLAFAVVEGESYESWLWFLLLFRHTMMSAKRNVITIASDRMKGLPRAVAEALPGSYHSYCIRHMSANFYSTFKSQVLRRQFMRAAYALRESVFKDAMERIKEMNIEAYKWIEEVSKKNWASVYFPGSRYNVLTTNVAECFNAILKEARELSNISLVDHIRWKVSEFFQSRQKLGHSWNTRLTGKAEEWFASACDSACRYTPYACSWTEFEVKSLTNADRVDLEKKTCTCGRFQTMGMPCGHAIAAMGMNHLDPYIYNQEWFFANTYRNTYDGVVHPTLDRSQWPDPPNRLTLVLPPLVRRQPGRPRKWRLSKGLQIGSHHNCSTCGEPGHNKRSCKNGPRVNRGANVTPIMPSEPIQNRSGISCQPPFSV
ncbi:uncharacterized protein LOC143855899 [Tasmannia lanceolata]|uniref:uncharacterized protein LOC143855899 n=1 Tax=Tasmannia lanceolata TaxID=3420 RepID=UPI004063B5F2